MDKKGKGQPAHKFGVANLAKDLKIDAAYVRTKLRAKGIKVNKDSGTYGWDSQGEYKKVLAALKPEKASASKKDKAAA